MTGPRSENSFGIPGETRFVAGAFFFLLMVFAGMRLLLLVGNRDLASGVPPLVLAKSFLYGLRFDLAVSCYLLIPLSIGLFLMSGKGRFRVVFAFCAAVGAVIFGGLAEVEFYQEFESRFNSLVFQYLGHPRIVGRMLWEGYPVVRNMLLWLALVFVFSAAIGLLYRRHLLQRAGREGFSGRIQKTAWLLAVLALMVFGARGGFRGEPLRWGDAFFSTSTFANHLALNGTFTLGRSVWDKIYGNQKNWVDAMPREESLALTRQMLLLPKEKNLAREGYPLLRSEGGPPDPRPAVTQARKKVFNVVLILQESLSARFVGALGAPYGVTPAFDRLAAEGVFFERAFSNGTHTHQGVFASLASFPNLPGYEYLMKMMEANQPFSSLPGLLKERGYQTIFLYNGLFSWDNKEGFFRQHGMNRFIGSGDYVAPTFVDPVWGVGDYDVFVRANEEFRRMSEKGPFFAAILTLSNHSPFNLPSPLPFERVGGDGAIADRLNGIRYADWSMGEFFRLARQEDYFRDTLFVITGDHGFSSPPMITPMLLSRFTVPLLFYAPGLPGIEAKRLRTIASQVDIAPSVLGLLGIDAPHQCWGRNLFAVPGDDPGFAVVKPSGGEDEVALIKGDYILIKLPQTKSQLFRFSLEFPPAVSADLALQETDRRRGMEKMLEAYVQSALQLLQRRQLGAPAKVPGATTPPLANAEASAIDSNWERRPVRQRNL